MKLRKAGVRVISMMLALAMLIGFTPISIFSANLSPPTEEDTVTVSADHSEVTLLHNGASKASIEVAEDGEETITAFTANINPTSIKWQILIPESNTWVTIQGQNSIDLKVGYSTVGSMLNDEDRAYIRAVVGAGGKEYLSDCVEISISYNETEYYASSALMFASPEDEDESETENENPQTYSLVINYIFDNGGIAFEPYGATVAAGSDFLESITSPTVVGYHPYTRVGDTYVDATVVTPNLTNINSNVTINVIYEPAIVDFKVHHHLQGLYDDDYSLHPDFITDGKGLTGSTVPHGLELSRSELPGFTPLEYELMTIAADGSTVVEIRYNRNYHLVNFDMAGGYGTEPVYVKYGSLVGANAPTRHGYVFDGWELVSYGGETPTAEQASQYDINVASINVPDANLTYRARWITQLSNYTMVFWKENITDNGFSYWGSLDGLTAMSGAIVNGEDRISEVGGIDDEKYFTYNDSLTDKNVMVEGDGSTIVNVYYTRNRYNITFRAPGLCVIPEGHTHTDDCYDLLCTKGHVHTAECNPTLTCTIAEHTAHTPLCFVCGKSEHIHDADCCGYEEHTHSTSCYRNVGNASTPTGAPSGVQNGYIHTVRSGWWNTYYYIYINGTWYRYTGTNVSSGDVVSSSCGKSEHTHGTADCSCDIETHVHGDSCYKDSLHVHDEDDCYSYSCGSNWHVHTEGCSVLNCSIPEGHTHSSTCKNAKSTNTVKIEHRKYEENLESIWPVTDDNGVTYDSGERWKPSEDSDTYSAVLVYIANMPGENLTLTLDTSSNDTYTMNYYLEVKRGEPFSVTYGGKNYALYTTVKANYNYITEAEDFFDIHGFYQVGSNPAFRNGQIDINGGGEVNFYYGRIVDHYLEFRSNGIILSDKTQYGLPYGENLTEFDFIPDYPVALEPGAFFFDGWYTSPGHYDGTEVDWDTITMEAGDVMLYAKWSPIKHTVSVYLDNTMTTQIGSTQQVSHGTFANAPSNTITNGNYIFQGWFYLDTENGETVEKAFVFTGIPVLSDMQIYAKWSSHVSVNYTINYVLHDGGQVIADPTVGSAIAGHNKTFYAKTDADLYEGFRQGYYPLTSSHTVTMSAEADHEFTFEYVYVESMPYLVRYLDQDGNKVLEDKPVMDNNLSVVTETFVKIDGMMPDAYQKRLVLSAENVDENNDGIYDNNVITFVYNSDSDHAYYKIVHYIENISGDGYREYRSEDTVGTIHNTYTISALNITGFSFNGEKTMVNGISAPTNGDSVSAELTSDGLLIEMYYDRVDVSYTVRYLESGTNNLLYEEKRGAGIFGEQIVEYAPGLTHLGYSLVSDSVKSLHLSANEDTNVIEFFYQETNYSLKYQIVGEGATLSLSSENVTAVSGVATGSTPNVESGYHFVGWYYDEGCTRPVPSDWVNEETNRIRPKSDGVWLANHTYYAKVDPDFTSLTITTVGCGDVDAGQIFIFCVKGISDGCNNINITVTVVGNSSVTVDKLPIGTYSVTELSDWSFRYTPDSAVKNVTLQVAQVNGLTFSHVRTTTKWLDGNDNSQNDFN